MNASYNDGRRESWTGLPEDEARKMTAERAMNPEVEAVEFIRMANGELHAHPARNRHQRRRDAKRNQKKGKK